MLESRRLHLQTKPKEFSAYLNLRAQHKKRTHFEAVLKACRSAREEFFWFQLVMDFFARPFERNTKSFFFLFQVEWNHNRSTSQISESKLWAHTLSYEDLGA